MLIPNTVSSSWSRCGPKGRKRPLDQLVPLHLPYEAGIWIITWLEFITQWRTARSRIDRKANIGRSWERTAWIAEVHIHVVHKLERLREARERAAKTVLRTATRQFLQTGINSGFL